MPAHSLSSLASCVALAGCVGGRAASAPSVTIAATAPAPATTGAPCAEHVASVGSLVFAVGDAIPPVDAVPTLFPKRLASDAQCPPRGQVSLDDERARGWIVPRVLASRDGSFTAPGAVETAILIGVGECNTFHSESGGTKVLAVFDRTGKLVFRRDGLFEDAVAAVTDLDLDGVDELVLTLSSLNQGRLSERGELVTTRSGQWKARELGQLATDDRGTGQPGAAGAQSVMVVTPSQSGGFPRLTIQQRQR